MVPGETLHFERVGSLSLPKYNADWAPERADTGFRMVLAAHKMQGAPKVFV